MVVFELREDKQKEESKSANDKVIRGHFYTLRKSKNSKLLILTELELWERLDHKNSAENISWSHIDHSKATILFYAKA